MKIKDFIGLTIILVGISLPIGALLGMSYLSHNLETPAPEVVYVTPSPQTTSPDINSSHNDFPSNTILVTPEIIKETIYITQEPVPTPTPEVVYVEVTPTPTDVLELGVWYKGVATSFSDYSGCQGDVLQKGDCAVGRRNYILKDSNGKVLFDAKGHTIDAGIPVYMYKYIPYGSKLAVRLSNGRVLYLTVKDDCYSTNEEKLPEIKRWNPGLDWDNVTLWVDVWETSKEESDAFGIRNVEIMILSWGTWNPNDR